MGIPRELLSYWETGARTPSPAHLKALARIYRTTPQALRDGPLPPDSISPRDLLRAEPVDPELAARLDAWEADLDRWSEFLRTDLGRPLRGPDRPPPGLGERSLVYDRRRASSLADRAREHWGLGRAALPQLHCFLDLIGVLVHRRDLGSMDDGAGITGAFFNHAELGFCAVVNERLTPARQAFTLAHGVAHALFHYSQVGVLCTVATDDKLERFADAFAEHFLVPGKELRRRVEEVLRASSVETLLPLDALRLAHVFRVSFSTIVMRLASERLIAPETAEAWRAIDGEALAQRLGMEPAAPDPARAAAGPLRAWPPSMLATARRALQERVVDMPRVAEVLGVEPSEVARRLVAAPPVPSGSARQEHEEFGRLLIERG